MKKTILLLSILAVVIFLTNCNTTGEKKKGIPTASTDTISQIKSPLETGQEMAMKTKAILGKHLVTAIQDMGTEGAIEFCSSRAIQLTDSMSTVLGSRIKRVAERNRNPVNVASADELSYIKEIKASLTRKENPKPQLKETTETYTAYYPILTDQLCLQCHGDKKTDIKPATLSTLNRLYPGDKATGFKLNELRGIWVVEMKKAK
ncbi:MAG TPA: DUF3365 domain-containing protein [Chitinophagaceae bacterium]|nr:DUF3365 domain-containing protein [Chitinophagaceae bacterium]HPH30689.1 DUF3365 domain-containing protein [Chitinophagaceae bacterium]HPN58165.1 DUF3365 domain-containing protein [Chitinophagaceae bacterium]